MSTARSAKDRLDSVQRELAATRAKINRSTTLTAIIGVIVLILLGGWFYYGNKLFAEISEPKNLVTYLGEVIDKNVISKENREALEKHIINESPKWAKDLSKKAIDSAPDIREKFEAALMEQLDASIKEIDTTIETEFRRYLRDNKKFIESELKELAANPEAAEKSLTKAMDANFQLVLADDAKQVLRALKTMNANWKDIASDYNLSEDQKLERKVWILARRLWIHYVEPERAK